MSTASKPFVVFAFLVGCALLLLVAGQHLIAYAAPAAPPAEGVEVKGADMIYVGGPAFPTPGGAAGR